MPKPIQPTPQPKLPHNLITVLKARIPRICDESPIERIHLVPITRAKSLVGAPRIPVCYEAFVLPKDPSTVIIPVPNNFSRSNLRAWIANQYPDLTTEMPYKHNQTVIIERKLP